MGSTTISTTATSTNLVSRLLLTQMCISWASRNTTLRHCKGRTSCLHDCDVTLLIRHPLVVQQLHLKRSNRNNGCWRCCSAASPEKVQQKQWLVILKVLRQSKVLIAMANCWELFTEEDTKARVAVQLVKMAW